MDEGELLDAVREANETALTRLGSERALVAATAAAIERPTVLETAAAAEARAATTLESWADDEGSDLAREAFVEAAASERSHHERVLELAEADDLAGTDDPEPDALHEYLRGLEATLERAGAGLVGRPLVASRTLLQVVNFFVNEGDSRAAEGFRDLRAETDAQAERGAELALRLADDEGDRERAVAAAGRAIEVAYEEYADRLSAMGVDPKPVC